MYKGDGGYASGYSIIVVPSLSEEEFQIEECGYKISRFGASPHESKGFFFDDTPFRGWEMVGGALDV